jgi:transcriptional regulator with XRE-family HTH domain
MAAEAAKPKKTKLIRATGDQQVSPKRTQPVDVHVGQRIRALRMQRGLSQQSLAHAAGLTFQQVQKYEKGANRVSASRLVEFAQVLGVEVGDFFEGAPDQTGATERSPEAAFIRSPEGRRLIRILARVKDPAVRQAVIAAALGVAQALSAYKTE